jgi:hypothetical protein
VVVVEVIMIVVVGVILVVDVVVTAIGRAMVA